MSILTYNGFGISQRANDGFVNATQMCQANGKKVNDWIRTQETTDYIAELVLITGIPANELVVSRTGSTESGGGTWIHPKLAICLGRWCNVKFAIWCDTNIKTLIETGTTSLVPQPAPPKPKMLYGVRRMDNLKTALTGVPDGYWTVIEEAIPLILEIECRGIPIEQFDLLDGSVGVCWSNYRKKLGLEPAKKIAMYDHCDKRGKHPVNTYSMSELPDFKRWLKAEYKPNHLVSYLESKYGRELALVA